MAVGIIWDHLSQANATLFAMATDLPYIYLERKHQGTKMCLNMSHRKNMLDIVLTHLP